MVFVKPDDSAARDTATAAKAPSTSSARTSCIAHLSDLHLFNPQNMQPQDFLTKRILGYLSWRLHRQAEHQLDFIPALLKALENVAVDQIVITGDLTHLGHLADFEAAAPILQRLGGPDLLTLVPGNHDAYIDLPWRKSDFSLSPYLDSNPGPGNPPDRAGASQTEPSLRICKDTAIIGVSSARPTAPFLATGAIGRKQLERLEQILVRTGAQNLFRLVVVHHPPVSGLSSRRKSLTDQAAFAGILMQSGAELILHGHTHRFCEAFIEGPCGKIPVIGVPSLTALSGRAGRRAGFHIHLIRPAADNWEVDIRVHRYSISRAAFLPSGSRTLRIPA